MPTSVALRFRSRGGLAVRLAAGLCALLSAHEETAAQRAAVQPESQYSDFERDHWSLRPIGDVDPPAFASPEERDWVRTPIDAFVLARLRKEGLTPAPRADRRTLIRRVCFDLRGLPPTPEETAEFLAEPSFERAWQRLVDRLLASPQYGIHWGGHWLDVVRFAESEGFEYDRHMPGAWMFRDYVVHAFNTDLPFDEFVREQLAGDEMAGEPAPGEQVGQDRTNASQSRPDGRPLIRALASRRNRRLVAAGFHRLGPVRRNAGNAEVAFSRNEVLTERTDIIGAAFLGMTVGCARCHDHMFDPIRQRDYYSLQAFLASTYAWDVPLCDERTVQQWQEKTDAINAQIEQLKDELSQAAGEEEARLKERLKQLQAGLPKPLPTLFSVRNEPERRTPIHLLERGDETRPQAEVGMRVLGVLLPEGAAPFPADYERPRSQLADWIASPENPLTARVFVNRIWQHHFGAGIVSTPNDFGVNGQPPSHPELLDWLAAEFVRRGWSVKSMHRLILHSSCYLQSSRVAADELRAGSSPPGSGSGRVGEHLRRRLSAHELRDAMLAVAGRLNPKMGGPSVIVPVDADLVSLLYDPQQWEVTPDESEHDRRSIYLIAKRNLRLPFLEVFDQPDLQTSCARRQESTHAPQALEMINGDFANEMAVSFAERLRRECGGDDEAVVQRAFALACGRAPTAEELRLSLEFLKVQPLREFALAVFSLNAFVYVD